MRKRIRTAIAILLLAGAVFAFGWLHRLAFIGAGYAAQQTCSCLFVSGRSLDSCRGDLEPLARRIVTLQPGEQRVRASSILSTATARFDPQFGCALDE